LGFTVIIMAVGTELPLLLTETLRQVLPTGQYSAQACDTDNSPDTNTAADPESDREWDLLPEARDLPVPIATTDAVAYANHAVKSGHNPIPSSPPPTPTNGLYSLSRTNSISTQDARHWERQLIYFAAEPGTELFEPGIADSCWEDDNTSSDSDCWVLDGTDDGKSEGDEVVSGGHDEGLADQAGRILHSKLEEISRTVEGLRSTTGIIEGRTTPAVDGDEREITTKANGEAFKANDITESVSRPKETSARIAAAMADIADFLKGWRLETLESMKRVSGGTGGDIYQNDKSPHLLTEEQHQIDSDLKIEQCSDVVIAEGDNTSAMEGHKVTEPAAIREVATKPPEVDRDNEKHNENLITEELEQSENMNQIPASLHWQERAPKMDKRLQDPTRRLLTHSRSSFNGEYVARLRRWSESDLGMIRNHLDDQRQKQVENSCRSYVKRFTRGLHDSSEMLMGARKELVELDSEVGTVEENFPKQYIGESEEQEANCDVSAGKDYGGSTRNQGIIVEGNGVGNQDEEDESHQGSD